MENIDEKFERPTGWTSIRPFYWSLDGIIGINGESGGMEGYETSKQKMIELKMAIVNLLENYRCCNYVSSYNYGFTYKGSIYDNEESRKQVE